MTQSSLKQKKQSRSYFDSAEFFLTGKMNNPHPGILPPKSNHVEKKSVPKNSLLTKKKRKYFDSADWMTNGAIVDCYKYK